MPREKKVLPEEEKAELLQQVRDAHQQAQERLMNGQSKQAQGLREQMGREL
jgi:hypothetical protein